MTKYLAVVALLGLFTFSGVSYIAHAAEDAGSGAAALPDVSIPPDNSADAAPADKIEMDRSACADQADAIPGKSGDGATDDEIAAAFKACMKAKHYTDAQLKAQDSEGEEDVGSGGEE
ncbi:MAG TPA: hypothetical protein VEF76_12375 [Patescibacteria group bacterium]|nr:hypothetical protein [Patescibacteria group bacterium]